MVIWTGVGVHAPVYAPDERVQQEAGNHVHVHALALYFAFYNFVRIHKTLKITPAMAAGVTDRLWSLEDIANRIEAGKPAPAKRGPYKKRETA